MFNRSCFSAVWSEDKSVHSFQSIKICVIGVSQPTLLIEYFFKGISYFLN